MFPLSFAISSLGAMGGILHALNLPGHSPILALSPVLPTTSCRCPAAGGGRPPHAGFLCPTPADAVASRQRHASRCGRFSIFLPFNLFHFVGLASPHAALCVHCNDTLGCKRNLARCCSPASIAWAICCVQVVWRMGAGGIAHGCMGQMMRAGHGANGQRDCDVPRPSCPRWVGQQENCTDRACKWQLISRPESRGQSLLQ